MTGKHRKPKAVPVEDEERPSTEPAAARKPVSIKGGNAIIEDQQDPFQLPPEGRGELDEKVALAVLTPEVATPRRRGLSFFKIAVGAFILLFSLAFSSWIDSLIQGFFSRSEVLGWIGTGLVGIGALSLFAVALREALALARLSNVQSLRKLAEAAASERDPAKARQVVSRLKALFAERPETARDRARLAQFDEQIIDGPRLVDLAETELLAPLDCQARGLILGASKRVSVVTAISPRTLVDIGYVLFEAIRLLRGLSNLYGGRPGTLGMMRLACDVIGHLAVTGSLAVGDGVFQQLLGHGIANRLSAKLGEGVINGLMTARIGIAAMDLCRPMPFRAARRPGVGEFVGDLTRQVTGTGKKQYTTA